MRINTGVTVFAGCSYVIHYEGECIAAGITIPNADLKRIEKDFSQPKKWPVTEFGKMVESINFSNTFKMNVKKIEKRGTKIIESMVTGRPNKKVKGMDYTLISNRVSSKTGDISTQFFLVKRYDSETKELRDINDMKSEIKEKFFSFNMANLPIPIKESWYDFFWEEVQENLELLPRIGSEEVSNNPMDGFVLKLPNLAYLQNKVERVHAKSEFQELYKRQPKIDALLTIADIKGWKLIAKKWANFLNMMGGEEFINEKDETIRQTVVRSFELFLDSPLALDNLMILHSAGLRPLTIDIRLMKNQSDKDKYRAALKKILEKYSENKEDLITLLNNFKDVFKTQGHNIKDGNWAAIKKYLETIIYDNVDPRARELAITCGKAKVSKSSWPKYQDEYLDNLDNALRAHKTFPTVYKDVEGTRLEWETMDMTTPAAWVVGLETYCCQHLDNVGGVCVQYAARNPSTSGILKISEKGKTVAQSFFWLQESSVKGEYIFVLDNIEATGKDLKDDVVTAYLDFAKEMKKYAKLFRIRAMTVGTQFTNLPLGKIAPESVKRSSDNYGSIPSTLSYTDAGNQKLVKEYKIRKGNS